MRMPSQKKINFFKVSPNVITTQIAEYVRNSVETQPECLALIEEEFKKEIWRQSKIGERVAKKASKKKKRGEEVTAEMMETFEKEVIDEKEVDVDDEPIPIDILMTEKINAKLFQHKLKKNGIILSLWEIFTLFEHLNTKSA